MELSNENCDTAALQSDELSKPPNEIALNPLANPKNVKLNCEVCSASARFACSQCKITYYCNMEHLSLDWGAIHSLVCLKLKKIRQPLKYIGFVDKKAEITLETLSTNRDIMEQSKTSAQKLLFEKKFSMAIPAALQALFASIAVFGSDASQELVPCYLLLGEASVGLRDTQQAEAYLAAAEWALLKGSRNSKPLNDGMIEKRVASDKHHFKGIRGLENARFFVSAASSSNYLEGIPDPEQACSLPLRARLAHNVGLLRLAQADYKAALDALATSIVLFSRVEGSDSYRLSGGYFQLGIVQQSINKPNCARLAFLHVLYCWANFFMKKSVVSDVLDEAQIAECKATFGYIVQYFNSQPAALAFSLAIETIFLRRLGVAGKASWEEISKNYATGDLKTDLPYGHYEWGRIWTWIEKELCAVK